MKNNCFIIKVPHATYYFLFIFLFFLPPGCVDNKKAKKSLPAIAVNADLDEKFKEHVRTTEFKTPEEERLSFKLPPGFEVTLFASEPQITKPINMAFDEKGRLWVTQSSEYPMAAGPGTGTDRITILEDKDGDGKADRFTDFRNDLNIPIGIMPVKDGAIAYSIPNIYRFADNDHDGKAEKKVVLFGEFGYKDTHGMVNNFIRGFDGWMYSSHGFTNTSAIAGKDGDSLKMTSGNTFRFRLDGGRAEIHTTGRVNPFGFAFDDYGYMYSADCHSLPLYQLIPGADYPHFGKKERGIGFGPTMMDYQLNSTALCGLVLYKDSQFPAEYQNNFYLGDVITCRVSRNSMEFTGSTPKATRQEDFLVSDDPWFRPVDIKIGPDGSMYIADFYNRIIGHYEVPLNHPGRDRISGRIWKITYKKNYRQKNNSIPKDWSTAGLQQLMAGLNDKNVNTRLMAADQIVDNFGEKAIEPLKRKIEKANADTRELVHGLWILHRLKTLDEKLWIFAAKHKDPVVQVHAFRVLSENKTISEEQRAIAITALTNSNPHVQRSAAEALGRHPVQKSFDPLFALFKSVPEFDTHLRYTALLSLRSHMRQDNLMQQLIVRKFDMMESNLLASIAVDVPTTYGAAFLLQHLQKYDQPKDRTVNYLQHTAGYIEMSKLDEVIGYIKEKFAGDVDQQYALSRTVNEGIEQRGAQVTPGMRNWTIDLASHFLKNLPEYTNAWKNVPVQETGKPLNPWVTINQVADDNFPATPMLSTSPRGAGLAGLLASPVFTIPGSLKIYVRDNDVDADTSKSQISRNAVRVRLAGSNKLIAEKRAASGNPNYIAVFDLRAYQGQKGYLEVLDSFKADRQSFISVGLFDPPLVQVPAKGPAQIADQQIFAAEIAGTYKTKALEADLKKLLLAPWADYNARSAAGAALMNISPENNAHLLGGVLKDVNEFPDLKEKLAISLGQSSLPSALSALGQAMKDASNDLKVTIAMVLANTSEGSAQLIQAIQAGNAPARLLLDRSVEERLLGNLGTTGLKEYEAMTANLIPINEERQQLINVRFSGFSPNGKTAESGYRIFQQNCSMCHQVNNIGGLIGPQLDGIGNWGRKALTEKILDPNRNISEAFRTYNITLKNGKVLSGLFRREEGEVLVFASIAGEEFSIPKRNIKERTASKYTLMPDHFGTTLSKEDFDALLVYLLSVKK